MQKKLLQLPNAKSQDYEEQVGRHPRAAPAGYRHRTAEGIEAHVIPGEGADVEVWILGSSGGASAVVAG